jgi:hypothetical protein
MWPIIERKEQEQAGGVADAIDRKTRRPIPSRPRRHERMRGSARQFRSERNLEVGQNLIERQT